MIFSCFNQLIQVFSKSGKSKKKEEYHKKLDLFSWRFLAYALNDKVNVGTLGSSDRGRFLASSRNDRANMGGHGGAAAEGDSSLALGMRNPYAYNR